MQRLFEFKQPPPPREPHHEAPQQPAPRTRGATPCRRSALDIRPAAGPKCLYAATEPSAWRSCKCEGSEGAVTHPSCPAALRARSARVPPQQQREGIGPTPTHRPNHTPARPQHVHTGRREGREATGGYAHRCEVVAPLALASGPARTCRAQPPSASLNSSSSPSAAESPRPPRQHRAGVPSLYT